MNNVHLMQDTSYSNYTWPVDNDHQLFTTNTTQNTYNIENLMPSKLTVMNNVYTDETNLHQLQSTSSNCYSKENLFLVQSVGLSDTISSSKCQTALILNPQLNNTSNVAFSNTNNFEYYDYNQSLPSISTSFESIILTKKSSSSNKLSTKTKSNNQSNLLVKTINKKRKLNKSDTKLKNTSSHHLYKYLSIKDSDQKLILNSSNEKKFINQHNSELPQSVARRNERERNRVKQVNLAFQTLRSKIPDSSKKMSKVQTLRCAVQYIKYLIQLIDQQNSQNHHLQHYQQQLQQAKLIN